MRIAVALILVVALAGANRLLGIGYLLPHAKEPDTYVVRQARYLRHPGSTAVGSEKKFLRKYPWVTARLLALLPDPDVDPRTLAPDDLAGHLRAASRELLQARVLVALLAVLIVPGTYMLARSFLPPPWALVAAALAALSLMHVNYSQQARPHAVAASFAVLAVAAAVRLRRRPTVAAGATAGACAGLALGSLQFGAAAVLPVVAALVLRRRDGRRARGAVGAAAVVLLACFLVFYPFALEPGGAGGLALDDGDLRIGSHSVEGRLFGGRGFARMAGDLWAYDPVHAVLAGLGALALVARALRGPAVERGTRADAAVAAAHGLPLFLALGAYSLTPARFALPLVPYVALLAAAGARSAVAGLARAGASSAVRTAGTTLVLAVALGLPAAAAWRLAYARSRPDTLERAAEWIRAETRPGRDRVALRAGTDLPLFVRVAPGGGSATYDSPWVRYLHSLAEVGYAPRPSWSLLRVQRRGPWSGESGGPRGLEETGRFLRERAVDYVVTSTEGGRRQALPLAAAARALGTRVFAASAGDGPATGDGYQAFPGSVFWLALTRSGWGPDVAIHRLERSATGEPPARR